MDYREMAYGVVVRERNGKSDPIPTALPIVPWTMVISYCAVYLYLSVPSPSPYYNDGFLPFPARINWSGALESNLCEETLTAITSNFTSTALNEAFTHDSFILGTGNFEPPFTVRVEGHLNRCKGRLAYHRITDCFQVNPQLKRMTVLSRDSRCCGYVCFECATTIACISLY